jgi:hypothetical protein
MAATVPITPSHFHGRTVSAADDKRKPLTGEVGITTSSLARQLAPQSSPGKFTLLELPRIMRDELDMTVIDLNTSSLASTEPNYLDRVREAADKAGCVLTNLKLNQSGLDMSSPDPAVRDKALAEYRRSIDAAARLGLRWVRPLPLKARPDMKLHVAAYQQLADYAAERGLQVLVENYGWMEADPASVAALVTAVGKNVAACPDTGNWSDNDVRYQGLAKTFPLAVTCDFKARTLGPNGEHELYDLKRCYTLGRQAGFHGPWCLEHAHADTKTLFRELGLLRDLLRMWMRAGNPSR